jgi:VWA domain containing CoxE-like protein.
MPGGMMEIMLETSRTIDKFESLAITKRQGTKPDPNGEEVRRRLMKDISEVGRVVPTDLAWRNVNRTYWRYRLASHKCVVREKITRYARKQIIFILLDGSGSMGTARKHWRASGVVMNRLKAVLSGDAELWLSVFDTRMSDVHHAATEQEALALMEGFMKNNYTGGGTNIAASVKAAHAYILKLMETRSELERPELWVLTDEDQSVSSLKPREVEGTRVNAMVFGATNKTLCKFAQETGGVGFENY